ncbi:LacI family DNA-binding transcriptional regulator [Streptomyces sp. NPDC059980]|uniref:LacI family DNA-binding transcriptional regulator n=1 Tax=Streptomyces sp. NPDC059980 TaxID=3347022 RepID=UPI0036C165EE
MAQRVTMNDVARAAGVSSATVSYVLSGKRPVTEETRKSVESAIERLGFTLNPVARSLRTGRSTMVALVVPDLANPFYALLARSIQDELRGCGYHVVVSNTGAQRDEEEALLEEALHQRFAGVVMTPFRLATDAFEAMRGAGIPVVVSADTPFGDVDLVTPDSDGAVVDAMTHIAASGRRSVGVLAGPGDATGGDPRLERIARHGAALGLTVLPEHIVHGEHTREAGAAGFEQLMRLPQRPEAVMCVNDVTAVGAMDAAERLGLDIPGDVALLGHDDIDIAALVRPRLSTIRYPAREVGAAAACLLLEQIEGRTEPRTVHVAARFVSRASV